MSLLNPDLAARLRKCKVDVQIQDTDTVLLRNVPADMKHFNKPVTNLLLVRPQEGMPFLICVDEDLEYTGGDRLLIRIFAAAQLRQGWRVLIMDHDECQDLHQALQFALEALGFEMNASGSGWAAPRARGADTGGILTSFGTNLTQRVRNPDVEPTVGRKREVERVIASISSWRARLPLIEAEPGIGKTNLLYALARELAEHLPGSRVISLNMGVLLVGTLWESEREKILSALFHEATENSDNLILAIEHLEVAFLSNPRGVLLVEQALDNGLRMVGTVLPQSIPGAAIGLLSRRLDLVRLEELDAATTIEILSKVMGRIAQHHGVQIETSIIKPTVERAVSLAGCLPSKAISLLDAAAGRAAFGGESVVEIYHVYLAADDFPDLDAED